MELTKQYSKLEGSTNVEVEQALQQKLAADATNYDAQLQYAIACFSYAFVFVFMEMLGMEKQRKRWMFYL